MIKLLYFMSLSEVIGCAQEELPLPHDIATVGALLALLGQRGEQ